MADKKNQDFENKNSQPLPGQMAYDELLYQNQEQNKNAEKPIEVKVIDGQIKFDDIDFSALNKQSSKRETKIEKASKQSTVKQKEKKEEQKKDKASKSEKVKTKVKTLSQSQFVNAGNDFADENFEQSINQSSNQKKEIITYQSQKLDQKSNKTVQVVKREIEGEQFTIYKSLDEVLHESMIPYTEYVVMDRALPRVEDGLKPVQRRILYSMLELGLTPDKPYRKSARIVGDCMGKYHPHGDSSVYDAMVRMAQSFSLREKLISGHGNFGSIDGDSAAAMRYTEAKLAPLAMELLKDLEKNTVRWSLNFDDTLKEPDMLPGGFPNLLVNGASGIAVGVATNIPPHNLSEVIDGIVAYIGNRKMTVTDIMKYIPAPDFPTGGYVLVGDELVSAYETGKGKIVLRAKVEIEQDGDKEQLVITELPYQVNKSALLKKIAELKEANKDKLSYISEIRDESDRNGIRAVIKLKKEANAKAILEFLYKSTQLQVTYGINMVAIANGKPSQLGLLEIIDYYVEYQREIVERKTKFDLDVAKDREHIVEGLLVAIKNIDEVVKIIRKSSNVSVAKTSLMEKFKFTEVQAQAILDMRLARLVNLEIMKLEEELKKLKELIAYLTEVLSSKKKQYSLVKENLLRIKKEYGNPRRTKILNADEVMDEIELVQSDSSAFAREVVVACTAGATVKQIPIKNYAFSQKTITSTSTIFEVHTLLYKTMTNANLLLFTNEGNCVKILAEKIPEAKWKEKGEPLSSFVKNAGIDEKVVAIIEQTDEILSKNVYFYTEKGFVKKSKLSDLIVSKNYYQVIKLKEGDKVLNVEIEKPNANILMVSNFGMGLNFVSKEIPIQARIAGGVVGINLDEEDKVIFASQTHTRGSITVVTDNGYGKKVPIGEFSPMARNRKGLRVTSFADGGKKIVFAEYSEGQVSVALFKDEKITLIGPRIVSIESRAAKGKSIFKGKIQEAYRFLN